VRNQVTRDTQNWGPRLSKLNKLTVAILLLQCMQMWSLRQNFKSQQTKDHTQDTRHKEYCVIKYKFKVEYDEMTQQ